MKTTLAVAMAFALAGLSVGLSAVPAAAVTADCTANYTIPNSELLSQRTLEGGESETGKVDVTSSGGNVTLNVVLVSNQDKLEFGIFELIDDDCQRSANVSPTACESDVLLDTTGPLAEDSTMCNLEAPNSGTRTFFVVFENLQPNDPLEYKAWTS